MPAKKRSPLALMGEAVLQQLRDERDRERALIRFDVDDDSPNVPNGFAGVPARVREVDPLASAQSRRAVVS